MSGIVSPIYKSIVRRTTEIISLVNANDYLPNIQYHNWEMRSEENKLPRATLLGPDGFSFKENEGRWLIRYALGLSSYQDSDLLHEIELLSFLQEQIGEGKKIPLLEEEDGREISELIVNDWELLPMAQSELRNYRIIGLQLHRTGT